MERTWQQGAHTEDNRVADYKVRVVVSGCKDPVHHHFYKDCARETFFVSLRLCFQGQNNPQIQAGKTQRLPKRIKDFASQGSKRS